MENHDDTEIDVGKAKTHKGRLFLKSKEPKIEEDPKHCLFINTSKSSEILRMILSDLVKKFLKI